MKRYAKWIAFCLLLTLILVLFAAGMSELRGEKEYSKVPEYEPWSEEVIEVASSLPVQEGGRIKPLQTRAAFAMLKMRGDRTMRILDKNDELIKIQPTAWMLDLLFRPELANQLPTFRVDNSDVLKAVGMSLEDHDKRDRYTFNELEPHLALLAEKAGDYQKLLERQAKLSVVEEQTVELASSLRDYFYLTRYFDFVRKGVVLEVEKGEGQTLRMSAVMATAPLIAQEIRKNQASGGIPSHIEQLLRQIETSAVSSSFNFHPIPPIDPESEKWASVGELIEDTLIGRISDPETAVLEVQRVEDLHQAYQAGGAEFFAELKKFRAKTFARAGSEAEKAVQSEIAFNRANWFGRSLYLFGFGSFFVFGCLLMPGTGFANICRKCVWVFSIVGLLLILGGVVNRYLVVGRPPVTNLYETIPFITAGILTLFLVAEWMTKGRIALLACPIVGLGGMVLATVFEVAAAADSLDPLVAVLRSNFWLTTHVLTITYGYAAGLAAAVLGFAYIFMRILGLDDGDSRIRRSLTRMTYGIICFTLVLSLIGTVLGGIWANDSWGRFWGWDPKENGALMIVLWSLFILHGRAAGLLREWGVNFAAAFGGVVVTFSWFHVNMLGTGLHSYGFTDGKAFIWIFYGAACFVILFGLIFAQFEKRPKQVREMKEAPVGKKVSSS